MTTEQQQIDDRNSAFWDELCGSTMARAAGVTDASPESLKCFDEVYMKTYPYLDNYLPPRDGGETKLLEIGLGYGTYGQRLAETGVDYFGLDIAAGPVKMMSSRLDRMGRKGSDRVEQGSALEIPHPDGFFDYVVSIGCLHHTGDLERSISEVHRVLKPSGTAVIMLYNAWSFRQLAVVPVRSLREGWQNGAGSFAAKVRAMYDTNTAGEAAPHTDYVSPVRVRWLFRAFGKVQVRPQNFDNYRLKSGKVYRREKFLRNVARVVGLDLYIKATKP